MITLSPVYESWGNSSIFDIEEVMSLKPSWAYYHCLKYGPNEKLENIIATNAEYSYWYAEKVLKGRFELGELAISKCFTASYWYARLLKCRFKLGEETILSNSYSRDSYLNFLYYCN